MDKEIERFTIAIGATAPQPDEKLHEAFRVLFKRPNYFLMSGAFLIVKLSRSSPPFWGVRKRIVELVNRLENYHLILLISEREAWVFSKSEVNLKVNSGKWKLGHGNEYKINPPLEDRFSFTSPNAFLTKLRLG